MTYPYDLINDPKVTEDQRLCFVMMPFDAMYTEIYGQVIKPTVESLGLNCLRADDIYSTNVIMEDVIVHILKARLIVADLTAKNPNVFYELGIAHSKKQNVILLTQEIHDVPFDLKSMRIIVYKQTIAGAEELKLNLRRTIEFFVQRAHIPSEPDGLSSITYEFIATDTLRQTNIIGEYGADSKVMRAREAWMRDRLSSMFSTLAAEYGMEAVEINSSEMRITFPAGYLIISSGEIEHEGENGEERVECTVTATLHTTVQEHKILEAFCDGLGTDLSTVRMYYNDAFDIRALFDMSRASNVKVDKLLPEEITFKIGRWSRTEFSARNENGVGLLEVKSNGHLRNPLNWSLQLLHRVARGEISKEAAGDLVLMK